MSANVHTLSFPLRERSEGRRSFRTQPGSLTNTGGRKLAEKFPSDCNIISEFYYTDVIAKILGTSSRCVAMLGEVKPGAGNKNVVVL
jgi:hypothetical protein